jgi:predicted phosphatase
MLDPVSIGLAISTASKAFEMIQKGFAVGRELEQMHGDMGRWMSATAEIAATAESAENAGVITRMLKGSGNIESIATQAVLAKEADRTAKIRAYGPHPYEVRHENVG